VLLPTVATDVFELAQTPPLVVLLKVVVPPVPTEEVPVMDATPGTEFTVTIVLPVSVP
jgi:hypothetical protein